MATAVYAATRVAVIGESAGQQIVNVFHVTPAGDPAGSASIVGQVFSASFKPVLASSYAFKEAVAVDMSSANGAMARFSLAGYEVGLGGTQAENGVAALIKWIDTVSGRAFRSGRTFLGPIGSNKVMPGQLALDQGGQVAIQDCVDNFVGGIDGDGLSLVMPHGVGTANQQVAVITEGIVQTATGHLDSRRK